MTIDMKHLSDIDCIFKYLSRRLVVASRSNGGGGSRGTQGCQSRRHMHRRRRPPPLLTADAKEDNSSRRRGTHRIYPRCRHHLQGLHVATLDPSVSRARPPSLGSGELCLGRRTAPPLSLLLSLSFMYSFCPGPTDAMDAPRSRALTFLVITGDYRLAARLWIRLPSTCYAWIRPRNFSHRCPSASSRFAAPPPPP
ncbi:hypothetical protein D1007_30403 [Hordeum vulgare]|nr:hypothetical protein D1007_30403 [Hordeum vulgare]